jgi:hypothetical protein
MKWIVTYRGKDGKQATMLVDAESRDVVFKTLADKHISAIRVEAAKNVHHVIGGASALHGIIKYAIGGAVLAATVATLCVVMMGNGSGGNKGEQKTKPVKKPRIETVKPNIATNKPAENADELPYDPSIISIKQTINPFTGEEMMFTNRHKQVKANAGIISRDFFKNNKHKPKRKLFKHYSENYICGLMRTPLGMPIVRGRLPKNFDDDFVKSYAEEIKFEPEDTEEDKALKQAMIDFKEEIKDEIANGAPVSKIVLDSREEQNRLAEYRKSLMRVIADLRREGATREELNEAREAANIMLDNNGLKRIPAADLPRKGEEE